MLLFRRHDWIARQTTFASHGPDQNGVVLGLEHTILKSKRSYPHACCFTDSSAVHTGRRELSEIDPRAFSKGEETKQTKLFMSTGKWDGALSPEVPGS